MRKRHIVICSLSGATMCVHAICSLSGATMCVHAICSLSGATMCVHAICSLSGATMCPRYLINVTIFEEKIIEHKMCVFVPLQPLLKTSSF